MEFKQLDGNFRLTISNKIRKRIGADQNTLFKIEVIKGAIVLTPVEVVTKTTKE